MTKRYGAVSEVLLDPTNDQEFKWKNTIVSCSGP